MKKNSSGLMAVVLSFILFFCTLMVFPLIFICTLILRSGGKSDYVVCTFIIILILGITAGFSVIFKKYFGFGFLHCTITFTILTVMCFLNPMNSAVVNLLTYRWLPNELVEILESRIASSLFFSIPMTLVSVLTLAIPALIKRVKERNH